VSGSLYFIYFFFTCWDIRFEIVLYVLDKALFMYHNMLNLSTGRVRSMADRKAELERKKAKLQALREEKERRRMEKAQKDVSITEIVL